jgi:Protein of unknown function (DUF2798)
MTKFHAKYNQIAFPLALSILMSCIISGVSTWRALGLVEGLLGKWMLAWGVSWLVAFPTVLVVLPLVRKIVGVFVEPPGPAK